MRLRRYIDLSVKRAVLRYFDSEANKALSIILKANQDLKQANVSNSIKADLSFLLRTSERLLLKALSSDSAERRTRNLDGAKGYLYDVRDYLDNTMPRLPSDSSALRRVYKYAGQAIAQIKK